MQSLELLNLCLAPFPLLGLLNRHTLPLRRHPERESIIELLGPPIPARDAGATELTTDLVP